MTLLVSMALAGWEPEGLEGIELYNATIDALRVADPVGAEEVARELVELQPDCGSCQILLAQSLRLQNRADEGLAVAQPVARQHGEQPRAWTEVSACAFASQDFELAAKAAETAVKLDPTSDTALHALQMVYMRTGAYGKLERAFDKAEKVQDPATVACMRVQLSVAQDDEEGAQAHWATCQTSSDSSWIDWARYQIEPAEGPYSKLFAAMASGDVATAERLARAQLQESPKDLVARMMLAHALYYQGRWDEAGVELEQVFGGGHWVVVDPTGTLHGVITKETAEAMTALMGNAGVLLVLTHLEAGRLDEARATLDAARDDLGPLPGLKAAEARLSLAQGDMATADRLLQEAISEAPEDYLVRHIVGQVTTTHGKELSPELSAAVAGLGWQPAYNLAVAQVNGGEPQLCLETLASSSPEDQGVVLFQGLRYSCAVGTRDLALADAARAEVTDPEPTAVYNHALLAINDLQHERALELLEGSSPSPAILESWTGLQVSALTTLGRLDEAVVLSPQASPRVRFDLAIELQIAGREFESRRLLESACPELTGPAQRECQDLLAAQ